MHGYLLTKHLLAGHLLNQVGNDLLSGSLLLLLHLSLNIIGKKEVINFFGLACCGGLLSLSQELGQDFDVFGGRLQKGEKKLLLRRRLVLHFTSGGLSDEARWSRLLVREFVRSGVGRLGRHVVKMAHGLHMGGPGHGSHDVLGNLLTIDFKSHGRLRVVVVDFRHRELRHGLRRSHAAVRSGGTRNKDFRKNMRVAESTSVRRVRDLESGCRRLDMGSSKSGLNKYLFNFILSQGIGLA